MHPSSEVLLSLRDGEAVDESAWRHVESCPECLQGVGELCVMRARLRALPQREPERDLWTDLEDASVRRGRPARGLHMSRSAGRAMASGAIAAAAAAALVTLWLSSAPEPGASATGTAVTLTDATGPGARALEAGSELGWVREDELAMLEVTARDLERLQRSLPASRPVVRAREETVRASLEQGLAGVEARLASLEPAAPPGRREALLGQRIELMRALIHLDAARARR